MSEFIAGKYRFSLGDKAYVMGILNVTPDSFSDGGRYNLPQEAERHALQMQEMGADIIDIGAQSTRPGSTPISAGEELERLLPVLERLRDKLNVPISVDTFLPEVAEAALKNGASIINDVSGFDNPEMVALAAKSDCGCVVMHHTGSDGDIILDIKEFFMNKIKQMENSGIERSRICLDPGVGFGKTHEQNLQILANTARLGVEGCALLIAASRKRVIGTECGNPPFDRRMAGTVAAHSIAVTDGADIVRVHDVAEAVQSVKIAAAIRRYRLG